MEMICAIIHQLTRNLTPEQIKKSTFAPFYIDHTTGLWPAAASGAPVFRHRVPVQGRPDHGPDRRHGRRAEGAHDYDNILRLVDDPDVREPIKFLREREIVHFQRFGEGLRIVQDNLNSKNFYAFNPSFD